MKALPGRHYTPVAENDFNPISMAELAQAVFHFHVTGEPQGSVRKGVWYCENSDCVVRQVTIKVKLHDEEMPKKIFCPVCKTSRMSFHHWLAEQTLLLVPEKQEASATVDPAL